ncbi:uncharacterized protein LOC110414745 isoform X2 [Herrania umbratica]|uniref:Uncharacterized protein LOC110414745 isoform X2 n=1 Tax=Herrania umbratica TaxID=108875 RepID=A0A6J1A3W9_9ROSI|nr:uncharacterized protein LOC110414745 isoform X2 [Herrania umbratica]
MEIVSSIVTMAAEYTISTIKNHFRYLCNHENQVRTLKNQVESLKDAKERVQHSVDTAKRNGEEIEHDVDTWLTTVNNKIAEEVEKVIQDEEKAKKKCFLGLCPSFWTRYRLSMDAEEEAKAVAELLEQGKFDRVSYRAAPQGIILASVKGFEAFESRTMVFNGIMEALKDASINIIGVHGMGGVGKTTLVKEVARLVKEGKLFDSVVMATVTQTLDVEKIQDQVADLLGLKFEEQSMVGRALRLRERLKKEEKILVVLDDIWARLDLEEVGIPFGNEHEGCTILLTSRDLDVLSSGMDTQKNFAVGLLNEEEAWDLFKKMAGDSVESCDVQPTAMEVAKKCAGLPIAIATVARALRNKRLFEWENALRELKRPSSRSFTGITADVYSAIELSYNYLEDEEVKFTFLLCSLIGHNGHVEYLLKCIMGLGSFRGVNTIKEARNKVLTVVSKLKSSCLLLDSYDDERFDIHDVVRDVAISIASRDRHMFVLRAGDVLKEWPDTDCSVILLSSPNISELPDELECSHLSFFSMAHDGLLKIPANFFRRTERLKVLDLTRMQFPSLPQSINLLTNLHTLCLHECALEDISVIGKLKNLEILSLESSDIKELPKEIAQLTRLRLLGLTYCTKLKIIPPNILSNLSKLEELYLNDSFVQWEDEVQGSERRNASLEELKHLSHLATLYVNIPNAQIIPERLFSEKLDRYKIIIGDGAWDWYDEHECSRTLRLKLDTCIYLDHGVKLLLKKTEDLYVDQLEGIKNVVAELNNGEDFPHLKKLHIQNGLEVRYIATEKTQFSQLQSMTLDDLPHLISFSSEDKMSSTSQQEQGNTSTKPLFDKQAAVPSLEKMRLSSLRNVKMIFHDQLLAGPLDSQLRKLDIYDLPQLKHVWNKDPQGSLTFQNLRKVRVSRCESLKNLFPASIAKDLPQLEDLTLNSCGVEEIVSFREGLEQPVRFKFPRVSSLELTDLEELKCFYPGQHTMVWPMLKKLETDCSIFIKIVASGRPSIQGMNENDQRESTKGQPLFLGEEVIPKLEKLRLSKIDDIAMISGIQFRADFFHHIKVFEMNGSNFPIDFVQRLNNLENLELSCCDFKDLVSCEGDLAEKPDARTLSRIRKLKLGSCKNLPYIWKKDSELGHILSNLETFEVFGCDESINLGPSSTSFRNLTTLEVQWCNKMINLVTPSVVQSLAQLTKIRIEDCNRMTEIVANEGDENEITFSKLKYLELYHLQSLTSFCPGNHTFKFPSLEDLIVGSCPSLKVFSQGVSTTPKLQRVKESRYDHRGRWAGDLNTTIQQLYSEEGGYHYRYNLELSDTFPELMEIWNKSPQEILNFKNLGHLDVCNCSSLKYIFAPSMALSLKRLWDLQAKECPSMEAVIMEQGVEEEERTDKFTFSRLFSIKIESCSNLTSFYLGSRALKFPWLKRVRIADCPKMNTIASSYSRDKEKETSGDGSEKWDITTTFFSNKVVCPKLRDLDLSSINVQKIWNSQQLASSFHVQNLEQITIKGCHNLKYMFPSVMVKHFVLLRHLSILDCKIMEEVIFMGGLTEDEKMSQMLFPTLNFLKLEDLPQLRRFCDETDNEFPILRELVLTNCPVFKTFISKSVIEDVGDEPLIYQNVQGNNLEVDNSTLFNEKVLFPGLKTLTIKAMRGCRRIWQDQLTGNSFCKLNNIWVEGCGALLNIFPFNLMERLEELDKLQIVNCDSLEEIFEPQALIANQSDAITATKSIVVETETKFVFPRVTYLRLDKLPKLKSFYSKRHVTEWPSLKKMEVIECDKVEIFASKCPCFEETHAASQVEISNQQPLFQVNEATFPILEELRLKQNDTVKGTWHGQVLSTKCFRKLKVLELISVPEKSTALPYCFIQSLPNLEKLVLSDASFYQIFWSEELSDEERHASSLTRLSELRLSKLPELTNLWNEGFQPIPAFCNLRILQVLECGKLKTLVPSLVSFKNLKNLEVSRCYGFINLITCSTAKSLMVLERMSITDCEMIEEIIACGGDEMEGGIVFTRLKYLQLSCLPSLASFCLGDHNFEFPVLQKVIVKECPKMKIFCQGDLSTPKLKQVQLTEDEVKGRWENDLKTTVKQMFEEMNAQNSEVAEVTV